MQKFKQKITNKILGIFGYEKKGGLIKKSSEWITIHNRIYNK